MRWRRCSLAACSSARSLWRPIIPRPACTAWGKVLFGIGAGLLTVLIRFYGAYAEGVSFAILFMNILTPYLTRWTRDESRWEVRTA